MTAPERDLFVQAEELKRWAADRPLRVTADTVVSAVGVRSARARRPRGALMAGMAGVLVAAVAAGTVAMTSWWPDRADTTAVASSPPPPAVPSAVPPAGPSAPEVASPAAPTVTPDIMPGAGTSTGTARPGRAGSSGGVASPVVKRLPVPGVVTVDDGSPAVTYSGAGWSTRTGRGFGDLDDDVTSTQSDGDSFAVTFTGTRLDLYTETFSDQGAMDVYLDGRLMGTVYTVTAERRVQQLVWSTGPLPAGRHVVKGVKRSGDWMVVDRFDISPTAPLPGVVSVDDGSPAVTYSGAGWSTRTGRGFGDLDDDVTSTQSDGDSFAVTFTGTRLDLYTETFSDQGAMDVYLDGRLMGTVYTVTAERRVQQLVWSTGPLPAGRHVVKGVKRSGDWMVVDRFDITR